jgi:DNA-binding MltR family transcriptional regulator
MDKTEPELTRIARDAFPAFKEFMDEFNDESDRAAVILGAAKLDYLLYQILQKFLVPNVGSNDELLAGDGPLSTFSAKIQICYRLGLIDSEFARALHLTRKIRNAFAHETSGCKLDSGPHRDRVRELATPLINDTLYKQAKENWFAEKSGSSAAFFSTLGVMVAKLEARFHLLVPISSNTANLLTTLPGENTNDSHNANPTLTSEQESH